MQSLLSLLFQIDQAHKYIIGGRIEQLRVALILLDNATEIQMHRHINEELNHEWLIDKIRNRVIASLADRPETDLPNDLIEIVNFSPLSKADIWKLEHNFNDKVDKLSTRWKLLDKNLVSPIKYIHRYRNEAYHHAKVRKDTIKSATLISLILNCELLECLKYRGITTYSFEDDYSWLFARLNILNKPMPRSEDIINAFINLVRMEMASKKSNISLTLAENISSRITELNEQLYWISEFVAKKGDTMSALRHCQYYSAIDKGQIDPEHCKFADFQEEWNISTICELESQISLVENETNKLEAFYQFSLIESKLEPIEACVAEIAQGIEHQIQMEIDHLRGK